MNTPPTPPTQTPTPSPSTCPNRFLWGEIVDDAKGIHRRIKFNCKKWSCPHCRKGNSIRLRAELMAALQGYLDSANLTDPKFKWSHKFWSLTVPGRKYREVTSISQAVKDCRRSLDKLLKMLRKHRGVKDYFWVMEAQEDGYPHIHLLTLGPGVADKDILPFVVDLWTGRYKMGNADVELVKDIRGAAVYLTKYISKGKVIGDDDYGHVYAFSRGLQRYFKEAKAKRAGEWTVVRLGFLNDDGSFGKTFWEIGDANTPQQALEHHKLKEALEWFFLKGDQLKLFDDDVSASEFS